MAGQRLLNDIFIHHSVGLFGVSGHSKICGNETVHELTREGSVHKSVVTEPAMGISGQNTKKMIKCWLLNQHMPSWQGLTSTQRQFRKLILDPSPAANNRLLSFTRIQSRVLIGLLTGHTLRRHLLHNGAD